MVAPDVLAATVRGFASPVGLWVAAALRVVLGLALVLAAPASRAPRVLRPLGAVVVVAGILTPFVGVERARAMLAWSSGQGPAFMSALASLALVFGGFIVWAVSPRRRVA